jgi:MFS superfamily sulfate permease-like transporter
MAIGMGNMVTSLLGGLPMISEVARSSSNVANGGKTRWANFFHGFFIFLFLCFAVAFSDLIPNTALAAMLIGVGFRLASPKEFSKMFEIGPEQLLVFLITILVTLGTDLLIGIAAGILVKMILHFFQGVPWNQTFRVILEKKNQSKWLVKSSIVFSNWSSLQKEINSIPKTEKFTLDFTLSTVVDHTAMENLHHLKQEFLNAGGELIIQGIESLKPTSKSNHPLSARRKG